jgi:hypothetical protein
MFVSFFIFDGAASVTGYGVLAQPRRLRGDDGFKAGGPKTVIPAHAGIHAEFDYSA